MKKHGANAVVPQHQLPSVINPSTSRTPQKAQSNSNLILIAGVVASLFLFWYVHLLTLNQLTQLSGGMAMPDSLIGGFDQGFVEQLRLAMDEAARGQLNYVHKTAGTLFPLIFGFTWLLLIGTNVARKGLRWALWAVPLLFAAVRLWGNAAIDSMMSADTVDAGQVALASGLTVAGWVLLVLSLVVGGAAVFLGRKRAPAAAPTDGTCPVLVTATGHSPTMSIRCGTRRACPHGDRQESGRCHARTGDMPGRVSQPGLRPRLRGTPGPDPHAAWAPAASKWSAAISKFSWAASGLPDSRICPSQQQAGLAENLRGGSCPASAQHPVQQFDGGLPHRLPESSSDRG